MENPHKNVIDGQCQDCGLRERDTDMLSLLTYACIPNKWREHPEMSSVARLYATALEKL